mgnify:FL=1
MLNVKNLILSRFKSQKITHVKRDKLMAKRGTLSISKARKLLKYKPKFDLSRGFERYYKWYQKIYATK